MPLLHAAWKSLYQFLALRVAAVSVPWPYIDRTYRRLFYSSLPAGIFLCEDLLVFLHEFFVDLLFSDLDLHGLYL